MINKMFSLMAHCLRWLVWAFHYAGTVTLIFILLFWLDNSTPGQVVADEIAASTRYVSNGEFRTPGHCGPNLGGPLYGARCNSTNAAGYAAFVKNSVDELWRGNLKALWVVMAGVYGGLACLLGIRPYFPHHDNGGTRSAVFCYGTPASRMRTDDSKQGDGHE